MTIDRRIFSLGLVGLTLAGCSGEGEGAAVSSGLPNDLRPARNSGYDNWVATFRERAARQGFSQELLSNSFRGTGYLPGVIKRDRNQVEFKKSLEDYLSIAVSDERVLKGRAAFSRHQSSLKAIEDAYGVSAYIVTAIWGLESFYGERRGDVPVISATSTLAYDGRRGDFFEKQLIAALKILKYGDTTSANLKGSWAGAMGHTQFIPTSYLSFAVDFTGDGRRDIWSSDPSDALASTAAYLSKNGWKKGLRWGDEVVNGSPSGTIIQPQADGPRFSTTANFRVIKSYNNSDAYAIGVGHLADRIAGAAGLRTSFPPDEYGMTKNDRIALQKSLTKSGFDTGGSDGVIGPKTIQAISDYQRSRGLAVTGKPTLSMIDT
ncbi:MAG: lytic murein transglycosylase [Tateyamaria sp.]|jgi:membrane-bound lytic murein transglycosylase B|nr:lytic murein transglycosylase [Tateyamaria sp.]MBT6343869.1 lytic murein transglycosylase [Tateyamaria sp.]MBT7448470.1 lytic murein transglycosylase [Tateyamaria sp.]MBT7801641.1 lytic murein transglycosylase [Tateyamaria sp.]